MAGLFDIFNAAAGKPDIYQQIAAGLGQAPNQAGAPGGPNALAAGAQGAAPEAGAGAGGAAGAAQPGPPQPAAYQSQPDMLQLFGRYAQQQQASEMFNRGIGLLAASTYPGRHPEMIMNAMQGMSGPPAGDLFGNMMKIHGWGQQQNQYQTWLKSAPQLAGQLGMTPEALIALGPDVAKDMLEKKFQAGLPPEQARVYDYFANKHAQEHANDPGADGKPLGVEGARKQFEADNPPGMFMAASMPGASLNPARITRMQEAQQWQKDNPGEPLPAQYTDDTLFISWKQSYARKQEEQDQRAGNYDQYSGGLESLRTPLSILEDPKNAADLKAVTGFQPGTIQGVRSGGYIGGLASALGGDVTANQAKIIRAIDDVTNYKLKSVLAANPKQGSDLAPVEAAMGPLTRFGFGSNVTPEGYQGAVSDAAAAVDRAKANAAAQSGNLSKIAGTNLEQYVDDSYLPDGANFLGKAMKLTTPIVDEAKQEIKDGAPREAVIKHLKIMGYRVRGEI